MNQKIIRPHFFKDQLWFTPCMIFVILIPMSILIIKWTGDIYTALGLICIFSFIAIPFLVLIFINNISKKIILENNQVTFKSFLSKTIITSNNFQSYGFNEAGWPFIVYLDEKIQKPRQHMLFIWPFSLSKVIEGLNSHISPFKYDENNLRKVAKRNSSGKIWFLIIMLITFVGMIAVMWNWNTSQT